MTSNGNITSFQSLENDLPIFPRIPSPHYLGNIFYAEQNEIVGIFQCKEFIRPWIFKILKSS